MPRAPNNGNGLAVRGRVFAATVGAGCASAKTVTLGAAANSTVGIGRHHDLPAIRRNVEVELLAAVQITVTIGLARDAHTSVRGGGHRNRAAVGAVRQLEFCFDGVASNVR